MSERAPPFPGRHSYLRPNCMQQWLPIRGARSIIGRSCLLLPLRVAGALITKRQVRLLIVGGRRSVKKLERTEDKERMVVRFDEEETSGAAY